METIIIRDSPGRNIRILLLMLGAMALCTWGVLAPELTFQPHKRDMVRILSAVALPFLTIGIVLMPGRLIRPRPVLILMAEGFEFSYGWRSSRFIPWSEVSSISPVKIRSVRILCVALRNSKQYMASLPKGYRWMAKLNRSLGYPYPVQINVNMVKGYKTEEVAAMMYQYLNKATKR